MSAPAEPAATPAGRPGAGVEIHEKRTWSLSGWFGLLGAAVCGYLAWYLLPSGWDVLPLIAGIVLLLALAVVPPGQTRVVLFFGRYVGTISNLMVVLCGDQPPTPIVNTGSLYS